MTEIFGDEAAVLAPLALETARKMERLRAAPEEIHEVTGWFRRPDGQWQFATSYEGAKLSTIQSHVIETLQLISPVHALDIAKRRVGSAEDGGYVMLDDLDGIGVCYSLGVGQDVSWDRALAERGAQIYQYDNTIEAVPEQHPNFHHFRIGITHDPALAPDLKRIDALLAENGHLDRADMILKIDIEGHEWDVLDALDPAIFTRFRQIVGEFHGLKLLHVDSFRERADRVFAKLRRTHEVVHVHGNNFAGIALVAGIPVADCIELSFASRKHYRFAPSSEIFPGPLDSPNNINLPDLFLGSFQYAGWNSQIGAGWGEAAGLTGPRANGQTHAAAELAVAVPVAPAGRNTLAFDELAFHNRLARPGTIIEVGANKGSMTLHFSVWERQKVMAFEPFPPIFEVLKNNLTEGFHGHIPERVQLFQVALGEKLGQARMRVPKTEYGLIDEWASLAKTFEGMEGVEFDEVEVPVWTIDSLNVSDVSNIKVDAEGYEIEVLHGAQHTLRRCRPVVSVECEERHRKGSTWYVPGFMRALDYNGFWHDPRSNEFWPISKFDRATLQVVSVSPRDHGGYSETYVFTFYYIPREAHEAHLQLGQFGTVHYE